MMDRLKILFIEDDCSLREVGISALADQFQIKSASNPAMVGAILANFRPNIVLFDFESCGEVEGLSFLEKIRDFSSEALVVAIVPQRDHELALKALRCGVYEIVEKPVTLSSINYAVQCVTNFRALQMENAAHRMELLSLVGKAAQAGTIPYGFFWKDDMGWSVYALCENAREWMGYTSQECRRGVVSFNLMVHPDDWKQVETEIKTAVRTRALSHFNLDSFRMIAKNGAVFPVRCNTYVFRDGKGVVRNFESIVTRLDS